MEKVAREEMSSYEREDACPTRATLNAIITVLEAKVGVGRVAGIDPYACIGRTAGWPRPLGGARRASTDHFGLVSTVDNGCVNTLELLVDGKSVRRLVRVGALLGPGEPAHPDAAFGRQSARCSPCARLPLERVHDVLV
ncbi:MAG: hypothetical protein ACRDTT_09005 [Pseudonocardiaceae bacterium]